MNPDTEPTTETGQRLALGLRAMAELVQEYSANPSNPNVSAWLRGGAIEAIRRAEDEARQHPLHTIGGAPIGPDNPGTYGRTHDPDCPGCEGTTWSASPRSEAYWSA